MIPFLERLREKISRKYENIIADAGYDSEENYRYLEEKGQKVFIKPADYEVKKTRKFKQNINNKE